MQAITLLTTEIEKIMDALVEKKFTGGIIKITEKNQQISIRDKDDFLIKAWIRPNDEAVHE